MSRGMLKGFLVTLLGIFVFFGTIPLALFMADDGKSFVAVFFRGVFGGFALMALGGVMMGMGEKEDKEKKTHQPPAAYQPPARSPAPGVVHHPVKEPKTADPTIIIQNIGRYIAGNKTDIRDSAVVRSGMGGTSYKDVDVSNRTTVLHLYRKLLDEVWRDGQLSPEELDFLDSIRESRSISFEDHRRLERDVLKEMKSG